MPWVKVPEIKQTENESGLTLLLITGKVIFRTIEE
jgi:hypothetical protein